MTSLRPAAQGDRIGRPTDSAIDGVLVRALEPHRDVRGSFLEAFKESWGLALDPAQWSVVRSAERALRGLYLHRRHQELFLLVHGRARLVLMDLRPRSATYRRTLHLDLDAASPQLVVFPPRLLHGWYFFEPSIHLQAVSEEYDSYRHDDNLSCHWADPELQLAWPDSAPVVSPEAERFGTLQALVDRLGHPDGA